MIIYTGATNKYMITELFAKDNQIHTDIKKLFNYVEYSQDIIQDVVLLIYGQKEEKLVEICQKNEFNYWLFAVLKNEKKNKKSQTNKKYLVNQKPDKDLEIRNEAEQTIDNEHNKYIQGLAKNELKKIKQLNWYSEKIYGDYLAFLDLCEEKGEKFTFEKFGQHQNIDKDSLWKQVKKVKLRLKNKLKDEL